MIWVIYSVHFFLFGLVNLQSCQTRWEVQIGNSSSTLTYLFNSYNTQTDEWTQCDESLPHPVNKSNAELVQGFCPKQPSLPEKRPKREKVFDVDSSLEEHDYNNLSLGILKYR